MCASSPKIWKLGGRTSLLLRRASITLATPLLNEASCTIVTCVAALVGQSDADFQDAVLFTEVDRPPWQQPGVGRTRVSIHVTVYSQACIYLLSNLDRLFAVRYALYTHARTHTHTHPFNGPLSGTTQVSRYQKGKTSLDFTEARDSEWKWHQLGHMQVCTSLQTDNHASTSPLSFLQAGCPSCRPTNSVKALKATRP